MSFVIVTVFKNERTNLKEWVDHYLWQGASHLYMCDNESTDNPLDILQDYIDKGLVTYWIDKRHTMQFNPPRHIQREIYQETVHSIQTSARQHTEWILIADLDEFWYCETMPLSTFLYNVPTTVKYITKNWRIFGPSQETEHPKSLRKELVYRQPIETSPKYMFRTFLVKPEEIDIHHVRTHFKGDEILNPEELHLNHYVLQSLWHFTQIKIPRGCIVGDMSVYTMQYWLQHIEGHTLLDTALAEQVEKSEKETT